MQVQLQGCAVLTECKVRRLVCGCISWQATWSCHKFVDGSRPAQLGRASCFVEPNLGLYQLAGDLVVPKIQV